MITTDGQLKGGFPPRGVLQIDEQGRAMPFDSVREAAEATGSDYHYLYKLVGDGLYHRVRSEPGKKYRWEWETCPNDGAGDTNEGI